MLEKTEIPKLKSRVATTNAQNSPRGACSVHRPAHD